MTKLRDGLGLDPQRADLENALPPLWLRRLLRLGPTKPIRAWRNQGVITQIMLCHWALVQQEGKNDIDIRALCYLSQRGNTYPVCIGRAALHYAGTSQ
jgi:hypothetical protein